MPIPPHALAVLEFDRVREALAERAATRMGHERALGLTPSVDAGTVQAALDQVEEALFVSPLNLGGVTDVRHLIAGVGEGRHVNGSEILEVAYTLDAAMNLRRGVAQRSRGPLLDVANRIGQHVVLVRAATDRLDRDGSVRDDATPRLRSIRRRLGPLRDEIRDRLTALMDRHADALQDRLVTIRRDRYVIPVRASMESHVPGIVVDTSASAQTVFVEPAAVVPLNNELAKLLIEEEQEVTRILLELARMIAEEPGVWDTLDALAELDVIAAKAALAREWELHRAEIAPRGHFDLTGLCHPLIEHCVPNDVCLDDDRLMLLITGPNMGGKTVTLKSLGLAVLMNQCGLFVKAERARLPVVHDVLADIGDEQSIEASLSTFAAHLRNLARILDSAGPDALVLIDELGSGTDPAEGAALSQAILEALLERGTRGVVTTHLSPLKVFAMERRDVQNASMSFDLANLAPTYHLIIGQPGRSFALAIARRLGFPGPVLERADDVLGPEGANVERLLENLESEREALARDAFAAREARAAAEREERELRARLDAIEHERDAILRGAHDRAEGLYRDAFEQVRQMRSRARDNDAERPKVMNELRELRAAAQAERPQMSVVQREPDALRPGASVEVPAYGATGTVLELRGDDVIVQLGLLKVTLKRRDLKVKRSNGIAVPAAKSPVATGRSAFAKELNLRGAHVEEAVEEVRAFIAEAAALKESPVRILHGKGEGVLRRVVRDYLKTDKRVESFHDAQPFEGGHGVTVAHIRT